MKKNITKDTNQELTRAQTIYQTMQILKFSNMKYFLYFDSCDDEPTKTALAADRMKRTRESNFSMIPFHN